MIRTLATTAAAVAALTLPAVAQQATASAPLAAASLQEGPLDLVAYYEMTDAGAMEVTATFAAPTAHAAPMRVVMALADGDAATFAMPGYRGANYSFERREDELQVSMAPLPRIALVD